VGPKTAGPENAGPILSSLRDQNSSTGKCRTENARPENAGPGKYRTWNENNEFHIYA